MKILLTNSFIQANHRHVHIHPNFGDLALLQLSEMISDFNEILILDNLVERSFFQLRKFLKAIESFKPDVIGISNNCIGDMLPILKLVKVIRKRFPKIIIVGGGINATVYWEHFLKNGFDFVVLGEGEFTFRELILALNLTGKCFDDIMGLTFKRDNVLFKTEPRQLIKDLDDLPIIKNRKPLKSKLFPGRWSVSLETSRGCPYGCNFCSPSAFWEKTYRRKSNTRILEEIKMLYDCWGPLHIYFTDITMTHDKEKVIELLKMILSAQIDIKWFAESRADVFADNPRLVELAKESGMYATLLGFETFDQKLMNTLGKNIVVSKNIEAYHALKRNNIFVIGSHMFGIPGQTKQNFKTTYSLGVKYTDIFWISYFAAIPGTPLFRKYELLNSSNKIELESLLKLKSYKNLCQYAFILIRYYSSFKVFLKLIVPRSRIHFKLQLLSYTAFISTIYYKLLTMAYIKKI